MEFGAEEIIKSCPKLESGLRFAPEGIHACCMGPISSPMYWTSEEASQTKITKEMIIEKRKWLLKLLNQKDNDISCKRCSMVAKKRFRDVCLTNLGHVNLAHFSICNLRCSYCSFTQRNDFYPPRYNALEILRQFDAKDVLWNAHVDLNGGEPTLLKDLTSYIDYFTANGIRIFLYTNSVNFNKHIYAGLASGTITWVITSLDAGTPSTFQKLKGRNRFSDVIENLTRYAHGGNSCGGMLAVKYVFCENNCADDDISGFTYAMLAIRPQKIWLTFDFTPLSIQPGNDQEVERYDYSKQIDAYARMYLMFKKHGVEPTHFAKVHLANVMQEGEDLVKGVIGAIATTQADNANDDRRLFIGDFRKGASPTSPEPKLPLCAPIRSLPIIEGLNHWSLQGKRIVLAPACSITTNWLKENAIGSSKILGFLDRDSVLHKKAIQGFKVFPYEAISEIKPDLILVGSAEQYKNDIIETVKKYADSHTQICVLKS
jgi:uncharacterized Fe-S cluster-containing radical SAM superfamily protein